MARVVPARVGQVSRFELRLEAPGYVAGLERPARPRGERQTGLLPPLARRSSVKGLPVPVLLQGANPSR